jgi:S-(hydroxymethyl)glutathione dehydrogenase/alcohol dehydrogenase
VCAVLRAAVCHEFGHPLSVEEVTLDPPGEGEVRVGISACAVCHSDVAYADGAWGGTLPAVFGHEACGVVAEVGPQVNALATGDRVVVSLIRSCGACRRCREGAPALCEARFRLDGESPIRLAGGGRADQGMRCGAFADETVVHASQAVPIPAGLPDTSACLIACAVMTGMGAVLHDGGVTPGAAVVVIGAAAAVDQGLACLRRGGTLVVVGMPPNGQHARFDAGALAHDGKRILGSKLGSSRPAQDIPRIADLYTAGRLKLDELVTATYPLERINDAVGAMRRGEAIRNVIVL